MLAMLWSMTFIMRSIINSQKRKKFNWKFLIHTMDVLNTWSLSTPPHSSLQNFFLPISLPQLQEGMPRSPTRLIFTDRLGLNLVEVWDLEPSVIDLSHLVATLFHLFSFFLFSLLPSFIPSFLSFFLADSPTLNLPAPRAVRTTFLAFGPVTAARIHYDSDAQKSLF